MLIFEDLVFEKKFGGVGATHTFDNGIGWQGRGEISFLMVKIQVEK